MVKNIQISNQKSSERDGDSEGRWPDHPDKNSHEGTFLSKRWLLSGRTGNDQWSVTNIWPDTRRAADQSPRDGKMSSNDQMYQQLVFEMQKEISLKQSGVRIAKPKSQIFRKRWETKTPGLRQNGFLIFTAAHNFPHEKKDYYHRLKITICFMLDIN